MLLRESFPVGPLQCNCTIVACDETKEAIVIDPGGESKTILSVAHSLDVRITRIIHTHAHFDHIGATRAVHEATQAIRYLHEGDLYLYNNVKMQSSMFGISVDEPGGLENYLSDGQELAVGKSNCKTIHTPGHTPGSCCFHFKDINFLASGDTLFREGVGRTDFPKGDFSQLEKSIQEKLYILPPETIVVPGHGEETTIGFELINNPYVSPKRK